MKMIINGEKRDSEKKIEVINPFNGSIIDTIPDAKDIDVEESLKCAKLGVKEWGETPLYKRIEIMYNISKKIEERSEELAKLLSTECGKPITQSRSEILGAAFIFKCYAERARSLMGDMYPIAHAPNVEKDIIVTFHQPLGVVACIIPFNYPVDLYAEKVAPALVMGNSVVVKPATDAPLTTIKLTEIILDSGVPNNSIQIITGNGERIGKIICESNYVNAISFTGGTETGSIITSNSAKCLHKLDLELGGNDPFIICDDADINECLKETYSGRIVNAGQTCCGSKRFLVQKNIKTKFVNELIKYFDELVVGDPLNEKTQLGTMISEKSAITTEKQIEYTINQGAKLIYGGKRKGAFFEPTILEANENMDIAKDLEVFGPIITIIEFDSVDDAIRISNLTSYGLQAGVMTSNFKNALKIAKNLECGCVAIGGSGNYRSVLQPFGGWKKTGHGREGVGYTLEEMSQLKTVSIKNILE